MESFREILIAKEYKKYMVYMTNPMKGKTWYPLILEVFVSFLFWIC